MKEGEEGKEGHNRRWWKLVKEKVKKGVEENEERDEGKWRR